MEGKLALLYLIFMLIITIAYVEVSPIKHAKPSPIVARISGCIRVKLGRPIKEKKDWLLYCTTCGAAVADSIGRCAASEIATLSALAKQP